MEIIIPQTETCTMSVQEFYEFRTQALNKGITFTTIWQNKNVEVTAEPKLLIELGFIDNFEF